MTSAPTAPPPAWASSARQAALRLLPHLVSVPPYLPSSLVSGAFRARQHFVPVDPSDAPEVYLVSGAEEGVAAQGGSVSEAGEVSLGRREAVWDRVRLLRVEVEVHGEDVVGAPKFSCPEEGIFKASVPLGAEARIGVQDKIDDEDAALELVLVWEDESTEPHALLAAATAAGIGSSALGTGQDATMDGISVIDEHPTTSAELEASWKYDDLHLSSTLPGTWYATPTEASGHARSASLDPWAPSPSSSASPWALGPVDDSAFNVSSDGTISPTPPVPAFALADLAPTSSLLSWPAMATSTQEWSDQLSSIEDAKSPRADETGPGMSSLLGMDGTVPGAEDSRRASSELIQTADDFWAGWSDDDEGGDGEGAGPDVSQMDDADEARAKAKKEEEDYWAKYNAVSGEPASEMPS